MDNLKQMTGEELTKYLSDRRNDDDKFSAALEELLARRNPDAVIVPADMPLEEQEAIFREHPRKKGLID